MTRKEALTELLEKVKAGEDNRFPHRFLSEVRAWRSPLEYFEITKLVHGAYHGSMDAALSLFEAVLPGWTMMVGQNMWHEDWTATVRFCDDHEKIHEQFGFSGDTPSRAFLIAILKALVAMEP